MTLAIEKYETAKLTLTAPVESQLNNEKLVE